MIATASAGCGVGEPGDPGRGRGAASLSAAQADELFNAMIVEEARLALLVRKNYYRSLQSDTSARRQYRESLVTAMGPLQRAMQILDDVAPPEGGPLDVVLRRALCLAREQHVDRCNSIEGKTDFSQRELRPDLTIRQVECLGAGVRRRYQSDSISSWDQHWGAGLGARLRSIRDRSVSLWNGWVEGFLAENQLPLGLDNRIDSADSDNCATAVGAKTRINADYFWLALGQLRRTSAEAEALLRDLAAILEAPAMSPVERLRLSAQAARQAELANFPVLLLRRGPSAGCSRLLDGILSGLNKSLVDDLLAGGYLDEAQLRSRLSEADVSQAVDSFVTLTDCGLQELAKIGDPRRPSRTQRWMLEELALDTSIVAGAASRLRQAGRDGDQGYQAQEVMDVFGVCPDGTCVTVESALTRAMTSLHQRRQAFQILENVATIVSLATLVASSGASLLVKIGVLGARAAVIAGSIGFWATRLGVLALTAVQLARVVEEDVRLRSQGIEAFYLVTPEGINAFYSAHRAYVRQVAQAGLLVGMSAISAAEILSRVAAHRGTATLITSEGSTTTSQRVEVLDAAVAPAPQSNELRLLNTLEHTNSDSGFQVLSHNSLMDSLASTNPELYQRALEHGVINAWGKSLGPLAHDPYIIKALHVDGTSIAGMWHSKHALGTVITRFADLEAGTAYQLMQISETGQWLLVLPRWAWGERGTRAFINGLRAVLDLLDGLPGA